MRRGTGWSAREGRNARLAEAGSPEAVCEVDRFRLVQVFRNVLDNALAACPDHNRIDVIWSAVDLEGRPAVRAAAATTDRA